MAEHRLTTVTLRWRGLVALVPAAVLVVCGIAVAQTGAPTPTAAGGAPGVPPVPEVALTQPPTSRSGVDQVGTLESPPTDVAPGLELPTGVAPGSSEPVTLDGAGIPAPALRAYRLAARLISGADAQCHIDWALVGAIGRVESNHARFGGNVLDAGGVARPGIVGVPLDGRGQTALIRDSDGGRWDHDSVYDRAVGPMQFIPGTWRTVGSDADGDGVKNPQDIDDAATATAIYLCSGPGDLRRASDLYAAIRRYNNSDSYVRTVVAIADAYRRGVTSLPAASLPAAHPPTRSQGPVGSPGMVEAAGPPAPAKGSRTTPAAPGSAGTAAPARAPAPAPTSAPATGRGGGAPGTAGGALSSAASSAGSAASSLVTSVVTVPVTLKTPIVSCVTLTDLLKVPPAVKTTCSTTSTTSTTTTTTTTAR